MEYVGRRLFRYTLCTGTCKKIGDVGDLIFTQKTDQKCVRLLSFSESWHGGMTSQSLVIKDSYTQQSLASTGKLRI